MVKVYNKEEKLFNTNGLKILHPIKAEIYIEDNGEYYLDLESNVEDIDYLQSGMIVRVKTRWGEQGFRLTNPKKQNNKIIVRGNHLWKDSSRYVIVNSYFENKDCNYAINHINAACDSQSPFVVSSDILNTSSARIVRKSLEEAIAILTERYSGHLYRDNWNIKIQNQIGTDRGVVIKYGKNSTNIEVVENWDTVITKILPVGYDGITLPEVYLTSNIVYEIPYTKVVKFEQEIDENEYKDEQGNLKEEEYKEALIVDLRGQAEKYLEENKYFKCNYKVSAEIDGVVDLGDLIVVKHEKLGIDITTNVIALRYDAIRDKYTEVEFGNFKPKLKDLVNKIKESAQEEINHNSETLKIILENELKDATAKILGKLGDSYVIYEGSRILVVDRLPKETATNVMMINSNGIGFSNTGITGTFNSAWLLDGTLDMQQINCINLSANLIKGGTLKIGSNEHGAGKIEIYDSTNLLIGTFDENGIKVYGKDGSTVMINPDEFAGYDHLNNKIFWMNGDEFHMKKSVVEEEITLCGLARWLGIDTPENKGIGIVTLS